MKYRDSYGIQYERTSGTMRRITPPYIQPRNYSPKRMARLLRAKG